MMDELNNIGLYYDIAWLVRDFATGNLANMTNANLWHADLTNANLTNANLTGISLHH
jgi:uncharacterized protein YjbI with pentapeptide repeats